MPAVSAPDKALIRNRQQEAYALAWFLVPRDLWAARVNDATIGREETVIDFDTGSGLHFAAIEPVQELWVGTAVGLDDIGRCRIRAITSGNGGVSGTVTVARNPLIWADNAYLTFKHDYPIKPVYSLLGNDGTFYKDGDIVYSDQNENLPPVAIGGEHRVKRLELALAVFSIPVGQSYAMAPGATIVSKSVSVYPPGGVSILPEAGGIIEVGMALVGQYWAKISVTDSNGATSITYRSLTVIPAEGETVAHGVIRKFPSAQYSDNWGGVGKSLGITLHKSAELTTIPDNTLAIVFQEARYGSTSQVVTFGKYGDDISNAVLVGYVRREDISRDMAKGTSRVSLTIETVEAQLNKRNFSVSLEAMPTDPTVWYQFLTELTGARAAHHFIGQHSTALSCTDILNLNADNDLRAFAQFESGTIYAIVNDLLYGSGIRARICADKGGRLRLTYDAQLLTDAERAALPQVMELEKVDIGDGYEFPRTWLKEVALVTTSGFAWPGTFDGEGKPEVEPLCAQAPGNVPADDGEQFKDYPRQTFRDQAHANAIAARFFARDNNIYKEWTVRFKGNYLGVLDTALAEWWLHDIAAADTIRRVVWVNQKILVRSVQARIDGAAGVFHIEATFEAEAQQPTGVPGVCLDELPDTIGEEIPPAPIPDPEVGGEGSSIITASDFNSVYRLIPGTLLWQLRTAEDTRDMVKDPFWMVKQGSHNPALAMLWRCGDGYVKRTEDAWNTEIDVTPPDPPNDAADAPAPAAEDVTYIALDASWVTQNRFACLGIWEAGGGEWRTWLNITSNEGVGWTQEQINLVGTGPTLIPNAVSGTAWETGPGVRFRILVSGGGIMVIRNTSQTAGTANLSLFGMDEDGTVSTILDMGAGGLVNSLIELSGGGYIISISTAGLTARCGYITGSVGGFTLASSVVIPHDPFDDATDPHVSPLGDETFMAAYVGRSDLIHPYGAYFTIGEIVAGAIDFPPSNDAIMFEPYTPPGEDIAIIDLVPLSPTQAMVVYNKTGVGTFARTLSIGGAVGPAITISGIGSFDNKPEVIPYQGGVLVAGGGGGMVRLLPIDSLGVAGSASDLVVGSNPVIAATGGTIYVAYSGVGGGQILTAIDDGVGNFTAEADIAVYDFQSVGQKAIALFGDDPVVVYQKSVAPAENRINRAVYTPGEEVGGADGYTFKGVGLAISRRTGGLLWATVWTPDNLLLLKYDISLAHQLTVFLGPASQAQVAAKTWWGYPFAPFSSESIVYVYGRLDDPQALGSPAHIIRSLDGGTTFEVYENSWAAAYCSAFLVTPAGLRYAIRATPSTAKLYTGTTVLVARSNLPTNAPVAPHGLAVQLTNGLVVAGSQEAAALMVVRAMPPYSTWLDITTNHGLTKGINAVEIT